MALRLPPLPKLLNRKIYKTGQTRGADDDVIYQNRVARNSTVLIPYALWTQPFSFPLGSTRFDNGFIVLISPEEYFKTPNIKQTLSKRALRLGANTLVFYETRHQWDTYNPTGLRWRPAKSRVSPLGGEYVARVPATTSTSGGDKIIRGFTSTRMKGAGIRMFEYGSSQTVRQCRDQLEAIFWLCRDSVKTVSDNGMLPKDASARREAILKICDDQNLLGYARLIASRLINEERAAICPLCLEELPGAGFFNRMEQVSGREVPDLTVTEINLFHIEELRPGTYNHRPYNLGWGHHHCNVVTRDVGIGETLSWMKRVLQRNIELGHLKAGNSNRS